MSKIIKVEDHVYNELGQLRGPGETYSQVADELLIARRRLLELMNSLEPYLKINKWREDRFREIVAAPTDLQEQFKRGVEK